MCIRDSHYDAEMNVQLMVTKEEILAAIEAALESIEDGTYGCLLYTSPSPRDS